MPRSKATEAFEFFLLPVLCQSELIAEVIVFFKHCYLKKFRT